MSFAILEQSSLLLSFVFAGQAVRVRCIVINMTSAPTQMFDGTEKPIRRLNVQRDTTYLAINYHLSLKRIEAYG